ncbi:hypothetical protein F3J29_12765 [Enterobacter sp. Cy-643]|uniref:hypothetical protein n=1 Tax=Enterobacter sp. Cy-643 TaxID=2608346 RepID=UPI001421C072|nr:hypothetical protein [Enterobacter sp. Cy-643]NIF33002.1 hypothetical protein [Enterobacter sp. Cy-643]
MSFIKYKKTYHSLFFLLLFNVYSTSALAFKWPIVLDTKVEVVSPTSVNYVGTWGVIDVDDSLDDFGERYIGILHRHSSTSGTLVTGSMANPLNVSASTCPDSQLRLSCLGAKWIERYGESGSYTVNHSGANVGSECVMIAAVPQQTNASWVNRKFPNVGEAQCIGTPPVDQWCALDTKTLEFDYGSLTVQDAIGKKISKSLVVECTDRIQFILRLKGSAKIPLSNGMFAVLTTNDGTPLGSVFDGDLNNTIVLTSQLEGTPVNTGSFSGNGILFVTYP